MKLLWKMRAIVRRRRRCYLKQFLILILMLFCIICYKQIGVREPDTNEVRRSIEKKLEEALKEDKGTGCEFPHLDPFAKEMTQFEMVTSKIHCKGQDWVRCYLSECRVPKEILRNVKNINCKYRDILFENDFNYKIGPPTSVLDDGVYTLRKSDHVKVTCVGNRIDRIFRSKWVGVAAGFRKSVERMVTPPGRENSHSVLILAFDSTSKNGFIRRMPKSYEFLTKELGATVLNGYNIVGDGTPAALFPILTGKTEVELPDARKISKYEGSLDEMPFIFYKLKEDGYRTAFFEDSPDIGTFQYRFTGFKKQPADHYLRAFYLEASILSFCVGDTLNYKLMMNITDQFFKLDGKHFAFTFISDICHDNNFLYIADEDTMNFLKAFRDSGRLENTLVILMGDHGPRFSDVRDTFQGKIEERLPLMAIRLPEALKSSRPEVAAILQNNSHVLTTPHDIHQTLLDAMGLERYGNDYKIKGADLKRAMSLFEPIPRTRSCSEAGIESHWCVCVAWDNVSQSESIYKKLAESFVEYINSLTQSVRSKCVPRTLTSIPWVMRRRANSRMLAFSGSQDVDGFISNFNTNTMRDKDYFQIKVAVGPGYGLYEASATYIKVKDKLVFDTRDISRTNAYNKEPSCISSTHPHLNMYCYCSEHVT